MIYDFELYADESGTHDVRGLLPGSDVTAVIGYFQTKKNWDRLLRYWLTRLRKAKLKKPFHMRELKNDAPYNSWTQTKRDNFVRSLAKLARDETWFVIGATVPVKDYSDVVPQWLKDEDQHPYFFCFRLFIDAVLEVLSKKVDPILRAKNKAYRKENEPVAFIFDQQQEFQEQAIKTFNAIRALRDTDNRLGSLTFGSRATHVPLQAADLMAYYGRRIVSHMIKGEAWRRPMEQLLEERHNLLIFMYTRTRLVDWVLDVTKVRDARILRVRKDDMSFVLLSDQMALWNEWYEEALKKGGGAIHAWEAKLMKWDRKTPLDADLWVRLLEWKKAKPN